MKMMCKACIWTGMLAAILAFAARPARADISFACGEGREKGPQHAELGFVDEVESTMKLFVAGKEIPDEKLGFKPVEGGHWLVSVDRGEGKGTTKYDFLEKDSTVQEFSVPEHGAEKKVGEKKKCAVEKKDVAPAQ